MTPVISISETNGKFWTVSTDENGFSDDLGDPADSFREAVANTRLHLEMLGTEEEVRQFENWLAQHGEHAT